MERASAQIARCAIRSIRIRTYSSHRASIVSVGFGARDRLRLKLQPTLLVAMKDIRSNGQRSDQFHGNGRGIQVSGCDQAVDGGDQ